MPVSKQAEISSQVWQTRTLEDISPMNHLEEQKARKRAVKRNVPDEEKDSAYWERRSRNNAAAKRSREIKRIQEGVYKNFVTSTVDLVNRLKEDLICPLLRLCPEESRAPLEQVWNNFHLRFTQSLPKTTYFLHDRSSDLSCSSPHGDDSQHLCDGDLDTDGGSHSSFVSDAGDDTTDLQIIHVENGPSRNNNRLPPQLSPAPSLQTQLQLPTLTQQPTIFTDSPFESKPQNRSTPFPRTTVISEANNPSTLQNSPLVTSFPLKSPISSLTPGTNAEVQAQQVALQKQQIDVTAGIPVLISPDGSYLQNSLLNLNPQAQDIIKQLVGMANVMVTDPKSIPTLTTTAQVVDQKLAHLASPMANYLPSDTKPTSVLSANQRSHLVNQGEWMAQQNLVPPTPMPPRQSKKQKPRSDLNEWSLKVNTSEIAHDNLPLNLSSQPKAVQELVPLVQRVFVSLQTPEIVEMIHAITQEFLINMGDRVPSTSIIWQVFLAIRDAVSNQSFQPLDCGPVIRAKFSEIKDLSADRRHITEETLPYQNLLKQFQTYLTEKLKLKRGRSPTENQDPAPKRIRHCLDKSMSQLMELKSLESADGGVIDNALHRCSVELEKRSQMRFRELEKLREKPGITIDQLHDELKRITNDNEPFQSMLKTAVQNELQMQRSYPGNGVKKK